jgi:mRNA-degrading endonuclease toxin of MazEF toxin-antitoxin module
MISRVHLRQGDLCLFNFNPSIGHEYQGKRPALVIQANEQIRKSSLVTVVPLTSNLDNRLNDDIVIAKDEDNRLISDSVIKVHNIISFDYNRFINRIGRIENSTMDGVKKYLKKHFNL